MAKPGVVGGYHGIDGKGVFPFKIANGEVREIEKGSFDQKEFFQFFRIIEPVVLTLILKDLSQGGLSLSSVGPDMENIEYGDGPLLFILKTI